VKLPIIGMGGIFRGEDAAEFLIAGATAVALGTANFVDPTNVLKVLSELEQYCLANGISDIRHLVGSLQLP
jgi:dihydroorotate dehydrogenase (NAD+) catalytic subunit